MNKSVDNFITLFSLLAAIHRTGKGFQIGQRHILIAYKLPESDNGAAPLLHSAWTGGS